MASERFIKGFSLSDKHFGKQLERIREIRMSERKFYKKVTDLYATAVDYDRIAQTTREFHATALSKMHQTVQKHGKEQKPPTAGRQDGETGAG